MSDRDRQEGVKDVPRLTWPQMREYWRLHDQRWSDIDYDRDPDGLANVCAPGQPIWLGEYYARFQRHVYEKLLSQVPAPRTGMRALDVGCGAGRWCTLLVRHGYTVTGIDIQPTLIAQNRRRYPEIEFVESPLQDFAAAERFDLVSCVTVLQHLPFDEQPRALARIRDLTAPDGHALVLENVRDQAPERFSRTIDGWKSMFDDEGFSTLAVGPYNYSPALRTVERFRHLFPTRAASANGLSVESVVVPRRDDARSSFRAALRLGHRSLLRLAVAVDARIEPRLVERGSRAAPAHCGFLLRAR